MATINNFVDLSSCSETKSQLYRTLDRNYISKVEFEKAYTIAEETFKLIGGFLNYLRDKNERKIN